MYNPDHTDEKWEERKGIEKTDNWTDGQEEENWSIN